VFIAVAALDPFSVWLGVVVGGALALLLAALPWSRQKDGSTSFLDLLGLWLGCVGSLAGGIAALLAWLLT
jgi:hypothetical protein